MTLLALQAFTQDFAAKLRPVAQKVYHEKVAKVVAQVMDYASYHTAGDVSALAEVKVLGQDAFSYSLVSAAGAYMWHQERDAAASPHTSTWDFTCRLRFWPQERQTLLLFVAEHTPYREVFEAMPGVEDYTFFTSSDRPEEIPEEAWERRREDWAKTQHVLPLDFQAIGDPYSHNYLYLPSVKEVLQVFPSFTDRLHRQAGDGAITEELCRRQALPENIDNLLPDLAWEIMGWVAEDDEGQRQVKAWEEKLAPLLVPEITEGVLTQEIQAFIPGPRSGRWVVYSKVVRDNMVAIIKANGDECETRQISEEEVLRLLDQKLSEEITEYRESRSTEELVDVEEVIRGILFHRGIPWEEFEEMGRAKREMKGAFEKGVFLVSSRYTKS